MKATTRTGTTRTGDDVTMKVLRVLCLTALIATVGGSGAVAQQHRVIFDTDFAVPPQDDGMALILALHSPEIDILGITTVAGNFSVERATSDVLRVLEIDQRTDIPVYRGANMPLVHEKSESRIMPRGFGASGGPTSPRRPRRVGSPRSRPKRSEPPNSWCRR